MHTCIHTYMHTCIHAYMHTCIHAYIHTYITYITYIHSYMLTPAENYRFRFFVFTVIFPCFAFKSNQFFSFIWRLWMLERDELWCFMCRYNDIFWWYLRRFRLPYCAPNKEFQLYIDRMRTVLRPNVNFKLWHEFLQCVWSFLWHMNFGFWTPSDLEDMLFDDQYSRYFFGIFFLTM